MSMTVLAVDDSRTIRDMLKYTLTQAGITSHFAEDGEQGLEVLDTVEPDVIITDINMPRLDVLTTESSADLKTRARTAGATGWIVKPFDPEKLIKALNMVAG